MLDILGLGVLEPGAVLRAQIDLKDKLDRFRDLLGKFKSYIR